MTQQVSWIRENMIAIEQPLLKSGISNHENNNQRRLTEAEIKVKRSLEKLSVPDWYLNKSSKPPKIMMHDTPIDRRLPPWRSNTSRNQKTSSSSVLNEQKLPSTASPQVTPTVDSKSTETNSSKMKSRIDTWNIENTAKKTLTHTQSFPKISPSRKIENINIVFPPQSPIHIYDIDSTIEDISQSETNSLDEFNFNDDSLDKSVKLTYLDKMFKPIVKQPITNSSETENTQRSAFRLVSPSLIREVNQNNPGQSYLPVSRSRMFEVNKYAEQKLPTVKPTLLKNYQTQDKSCQVDAADPQLDVPVRCSSKLTDLNSCKRLTPINEDKENNQLMRKIKSSSSSNAFMETTKKSTILERIVKRKMSRGTGFIHEIITEFQKRCSETSSSVSSNSSKKFVTKLVNVLEKSICDDSDKSKVMNGLEDTSKFYLKSNNIDVHNKYGTESKFFSNATSLKKTISDNNAFLSTLYNSPHYNQNMQTKPSINDEVPQSSTNNIRWIPLPIDNPLPRTSSVLSDISKSSYFSDSSPCLSPILKEVSPCFFGRNKDCWSSVHEKSLKTLQSSMTEKPNSMFDSQIIDHMENSSLLESFLAKYEASVASTDIHDTSTDRRLTFNKTPSIFTRPIIV